MENLKTPLKWMIWGGKKNPIFGSTPNSPPPSSQVPKRSSKIWSSPLLMWQVDSGSSPTASPTASRFRAVPQCASSSVAFRQTFYSFTPATTRRWWVNPTFLRNSKQPCFEWMEMVKPSFFYSKDLGNHPSWNNHFNSWMAIRFQVYYTNQLNASRYTGWWFQIFFIFIPTWGNDPTWLIFFKWVETTN